MQGITKKEQTCLLKYSNEAPLIPLISFKVKVSNETKIVNRIIELLKAQKFIINIMPAIENELNVYFILLSMSRE